MGQIDVIAPSLYEEHGHIAYGEDGIPNFRLTKEKFLNNLFKYNSLNDEDSYFPYCGSSNSQVQKEVLKIKSKYKEKFRRNFSIDELGFGKTRHHRNNGRDSTAYYGHL